MSDVTNIREAVGPVGDRLDGVHRIAVLRGGGLGDVLFAMPALHALSTAYPDAEITLLGTPLHRALLEGRDGPVRHVEILPFAEGVRPGPEDPIVIKSFMDRLRGRFDLAVQLHGGGRFSNPFLLRLGAPHTVGTATRDATPLERTLPYLYYQHEVLRALEVVGLVGATTAQISPKITVMPSDRAEAADFLTDAKTGHPRLVIHPGATDARRRWSAQRFGLLARWAAQDGWDVDVIGDDSEKELAARVARVGAPGRADVRADAARAEPAGAWGPDRGRDLSHVKPMAATPGRVRSLAGKLNIPGLVGVLEAADVLVGNDSGPRHLAQAVGTPTVGIYWAGNAIMAAPLARAEHRVHLGWTTRCPVCGADVSQVGWTAQKCRHVFPLTDAVRPQDVYADVLDLLDERRSRP